MPLTWAAANDEPEKKPQLAPGAVVMMSVPGATTTPRPTVAPSPATATTS